MLNGLLHSHPPKAEVENHPLRKINNIKNKVTDCERIYSEELSKPDHYAKQNRFMM